jgi:hypothetical protein
MKTLSYSIASLLVLSVMILPAGLRAQGPTVASSFSIENSVGERVTLDIPNSGVVPYTIFFPAFPPTAGSLFYGTTSGGNTAWLAPGSLGSVLQIGLSGDPEWSMVNTLPNGSGTNTILVWDGTSWVSNPNFSSDPANGNTTIGGDLTVTGPNVNLPAGSISNTELENSSIAVNSGTGLSGGGTVPLGGSITLQNTGLLSASGIGSGIDVQTSAGAVTIENTGVTGLTAGNGIDLSGSTGSVTVSNTGILSILGTANQVNVSTVAGVATLSTPQDIHTGAAPTFAGMTLTGLSAGASNQVLIRNTTTNAVETRTIFTLPGGIGTNTTLIWDGTNWVENTAVTMSPTGDIATTGDLSADDATLGGTLTVNSGGDVVLPNGVIDNSELANSSINVSYGGGLSGDASVALGGTLNLNNSGVTGLTAGNGINLSGSTGNVTVTNTGILSVLGTANQVNVSTVAGVATLSTPQDIHTGAAPTFAGMTLTGLSAGTSNQVLIRNTTTNEVETRTIFTLPGGIGTNTTLIWDGTNWVENTSVTMTPSGDITTNGDLTVSGTSVTLPAGSIDNSELANSSVTVNAGTGMSGGGTVALGGSITLDNDGILSVSGTGSGIDVQTTGGAVTVENTGVTGLTAGNGINLSGSSGNVTVTNSGILSVVGTANQVNVSTVAGVATLSTPQNIHTDAVPTFDGMILDNLNNGSTATEVVVSNGGTLETRSLGSLVGGSGRVSTASATSGGSGWSMTITDAAVSASNSILLTYEDPTGSSNKSVHVTNRIVGTSFDVQFSGKPVTGSFVNYYILP